jgi:hypothetical protein
MALSILDSGMFSRRARSLIRRPVSRSAPCATVQSNRVFVTVECLYVFKTALADGIKRIVAA